MDGIAIVGMAGRFPGAASIEEYWANLIAGRESITRFEPSQLDASIPTAQRNHPRYVAARGVLSDADRFDAAFFDIPAREALLTDPQQRVFLELCWNALEHAAIDTTRTKASIGVYAGVSNNSYRKLVEARPDLVNASGEFVAMLANEKDYVATRVAHRIGLNGPAISLYTACSTSLVAVAQAWYALMSWQCDVALAGGINIMVPQESGYIPVDGGMESSDGHCRPFDAQADGTLFSSGGGVVVLKRLADAINDGDTIWAVIRGVGVNNDGADKASFTAPSVRGQADAIGLALSCAGVTADSIGYVEAHGTGTHLGDPIEVEALTRAFRATTERSQYCWLGSVKSNFGHLVAGSGVAGLIKAALALHHGKIPPTLHFSKPNPEIDFASTPFKVVDRVTAWLRGDHPRRAGVSSFGVGGTNAHVVLEEAPARADAKPGRSPAILALSARDEDALRRRTATLGKALPGYADADLPDVAWTLAVGRRALRTRTAVVARTMSDAEAALPSAKPFVAEERSAPIFLFPGQGAQHANMARGLLDSEPVFAAAFERCCALASKLLERDLRALILPAPGDEEVANRTLTETRYAQPALFAVEYSLAQCWMAWDVKPQSMIGHSIGEYVAACVAGVFSVEDAIRLIVARGAAMHAQPRGTMLALRASEDEVVKILPQGVELAAVNAPRALVVGGSPERVDAFARTLVTADIAHISLRTSHAFHSASMDAASAMFRKAFDGLRLQAPKLPFYSCVSGKPITAEEATSPDYWCRQLRRPVRFADAVRDAATSNACALIEVGPGQALSKLARGVPEWSNRTVPSLGADGDGHDADRLAEAVAGLWCRGGEIDWDAYHDGKHRRRLPLPGYPFAGERYWIEASAEAANAPLLPQALAVVPPPSVSAEPRAQRLRAELREMFESLSGESIAASDDDTRFLDIGLDSLSLTQAALALEKKYGQRLKFRRLMEDLDTVARLAAWLDETLPPEIASAPTQMPSVDGAPNDVTQLLHSQMQLLQQQAALLAKLTGTPAPAIAPPAVADDAQPADLRERPFGAAARITMRPGFAETPQQKAWLDNFTRSYNERTAKSKAFSQQHRMLMADPRVVTGFNPLWKELVYPIVVERSKGARMWDIDGHEYIDLLNGFGANFLGYQPDFIAEALVDQINAGMEIGPQHPLTAEVAQLISDMTGMPRVAFCNTGSEAVMGAMRIARTVTGRKTIVIFKDSYHGIFDEVIVRGTKQLRSIAAAPGILANAVENVMVLDYGSPESLRAIREHAADLAAVMIEPVQGKNPSLQPREFVHELRAICDSAGCALIFDEVITGFRIAPGGAQEFYGIRADIATYGKIIGGGLPFAAIAGRPGWMDALDGGHWQYGDDSYPEAGVTYFAGTFVRHPLALAAAKAALLHVKHAGPELQRSVNARTRALVDRLNTFFAMRNAPLHAVTFASLWRIWVDADQPMAEIFYYALRQRGLHVYAQFNCFLTTAHGDAEAATIAERIEDAVTELLGAGILTPRASDAPPQKDESILGGTPDEVRITDAQLEKWLACQFGDAANTAFNESLLLTLDGALDKGLLQRAVEQMTARHEAFSMSFASDGTVMRAGTQRGIVPIEVSIAEAQLEAHCAMSMRRPFDLTTAPLARIELIELAPRRHVLFVVAHHLIFDGWSAAVFLDELALTYRALRDGHTPDLSPAESLRTYALTEYTRRDSDDARAQLDYWTRLYAKRPDALDLPSDRPRPAQPTFAADTLRYTFTPQATDALRRLARRCGATLYSVLLAGFGVLLSRLSGQRDFAIGIPFAGQALAGNGSLIGDGVNTLPLRIGVDPEQPFIAFAKQCHGLLLDAADNQDLTLHTLLRALQLQHGADRSTLASVIFNLNPRIPSLDFGDVAATLRDAAKTALVWDLFFNFNETDNGLSLDLHYSTDLYSAATMRRWIGHFETLLAAAAAHDDEPLAQLPLLDAAQRQAFAQQWKASARDVDLTRSLPALFADQAARMPDRVAVVSGAASLTYAQLLDRARAIAHALRERGITRGDLVGVAVPRGIDMLAAVLGTMMSGAAYVALDLNYPLQRLQFVADHAQLKVLLTGSASDLPAALAAGRTLLAMNAVANAAAGELPAISGDDTAYVLYTSGSTGEPKGVRVLHRNLTNFLAGMRERPGLGADDILCAVTTLSFDIAGLELYLPLTLGARVVIASDEEHRDPAALMKRLSESQATVLQTTPSLLRVLLDGGDSDALRATTLLIGGEELPRDLAERALKQSRALWNMYGPTETTIWSVVGRVESGSTAVPLGTPIANTQVYVLDAIGQLVPEGVRGEMWIGGAGVAAGYLHRPELTAERFVADPFCGGTMYRTGDRGAWRDGQFYFHGRGDDQIKLRGFRIEPAEIEAAAMSVASVRAAVVVVPDVGANDRRLALYVAAPVAGANLAGELREALQRQLPPQMVPQYIEIVPALPQTANGKIDRQALPMPSALSGSTGAEKPAAAPREGLETTFAQIWRELLRVERVHRDDNFFDLGGDSLLGVHLFRRIHAITGVNLPLTTLLTSPTLASQARVFRAAGATAQTTVRVDSVADDESLPSTPAHDQWSPLVPIQPEGSRTPLICVHAMGGNVLNYLQLARGLGKDQPVYGLQAQGLDGITRPLRSIKDMASLYRNEIRRRFPEGPYFLCGGSMGGTIAYEVAQQLIADGAQVGLLGLFDTYGPNNRFFEIERGGSLQRIQYRWRDRWVRAMALTPRGQWDMVWSAFKRRVTRVNEAAEKTWCRLRGTALPHGLRYRELERANMHAFYRYQAKPYPGMLTLFRAEVQPYELLKSRDLGWNAVADGGIEILDIPGTHDTLIEQPQLLVALRDVLAARARKDPSP
jgi:amino acid adenylation domain-containing protein